MYCRETSTWSDTKTTEKLSPVKHKIYHVDQHGKHVLKEIHLTHWKHLIKNNYIMVKRENKLWIFLIWWSDRGIHEWIGKQFKKVLQKDESIEGGNDREYLERSQTLFREINSQVGFHPFLSVLSLHRYNPANLFLRPILKYRKCIKEDLRIRDRALHYVQRRRR